jgi:hypothetical protein
MTPRLRNMPPEPIMSSLRRPILSMSEIATMVTTMFVTEVMTVWARASSSLNPTACHSVEE